MINLFYVAVMTPCPQRAHLRSGFTLVEISIVLVVIGLIIGAIFVGKDLIRAAQLRGIVTEVDKIKTAINTFKLKFNCIPGDCANATDYFPAANAVPNTCYLTNRTTPSTCNGTGDGLVDYADSSVHYEEPAMLWEHLSLAGLIGGSLVGYTTTTGSGLYQFLLGTNVLPSRAINGTGYSVSYGSSFFVGRVWPVALNHHIIFYGKYLSTLTGLPGDFIIAGTIAHHPLLDPKQA